VPAITRESGIAITVTGCRKNQHPQSDSQVSSQRWTVYQARSYPRGHTGRMKSSSTGTDLKSCGVAVRQRSILAGRMY
jgi:hypothetical protein